jgi:RsiW-degrading membrane proteinase PrsW (M82 family)
VSARSKPCLARATRLAIAAIALAFAFASAGCEAPHLAGTNDAALEYEVRPDPATGTTLDAQLAAAGVKARISSALAPSDVDTTESGAVRVVVDADVAGAVDDLLAWRGGIRVSRSDDGMVLAPIDTTGLRPMSAPAPGTPAGEERWWQGTGEAVARAVRTTKLDTGHVAFAEKLPNGEYRTRVAISPPVVTLGFGATPIDNIQPIERGRALAVTLPGESQTLLSSERQSHPGAHLLLSRGSTLIEILTVEEAAAAPLVLRFGDDLMAYTRAYRAKLLLRSPVLPPLHRLSAGPLPARWGLAAASAVLPFLLSFAWLFFVRRFDRGRPEPLWLVLATFALGGLSIIPAALIEAGCSALSPWLDSSVVSMGGQLWALPLTIAVSTLVVGGAEEGSKFLGAWSLARHRREFDEPVDGIVYGCASALGFAAVENIKYFAFGRMSGAVIAIRAMETVPAHMFFGAIWGYGMGRTLVSRKARVWPWLLAACLAHGTFDALLSTDGLQIFATVLVLGLALAFVVMLRKSLRHGAVPVKTTRPADAAGFEPPPPTEPMPLSELPRTYFRVGSPGAFMASAAAMILCAFSITVLGTVYEVLHHRVNIVVILIAAVLLGLFGLASWAVSATIPLDVAVDALGITFAGAQTPWRAIATFTVEQAGTRTFVRLETREGPVRIGPTDPQTATSIVSTIHAARTA